MYELDSIDLNQIASNSCAKLRVSTNIEKATASLKDVETTYKRLSEVIVAKVLKGEVSV